MVAQPASGPANAAILAQCNMDTSLPAKLNCVMISAAL